MLEEQGEKVLLALALPVPVPVPKLKPASWREVVVTYRLTTTLS
jgi:hypothetical protein